MAASLSAYWVKFFKNAGFPQDVATKHAVVFSNNRIKPDMLPDLDKPSLKEMGITLMGDMIAILRYAKKVVEETTCERFLVDTEDTATPGKATVAAKPAVKKAAVKTVAKTAVSAKPKPECVTKKIVKVPSTSDAKTVKKTISTSSGSVTELAIQKKQVPLKRKLEEEEDFDDSNEDEWNAMQKKLKTTSNDKDNRVGYTVILPKAPTQKTQQILKKSQEQKRTVFDRLGDSSVTSTTNLAETSPTFNITGLGKDVYKRSVFNRLGDKEAKKETSQTSQGILKNGTSSPGILKNRSVSGRTLISTKNTIARTGTMRADHEINLKNTSNSMKLVKTKKITFNDSPARNTESVKSITSGKLASERLTNIPAKARLGVVRNNGAKQVTFNRTTTVTHVRKPDVFSRLGI